MEPPTPIRPSPIDWAELEARVPKPERWEDLAPRERQAYLLRFSTDPPMARPQVAQLLGVSQSSLSPLWSSIRKKTGIDSLEGRSKQAQDTGSGRVPQGEFLQLIEQNVRRILKGMDSARVAKANLKDLSASTRDLMTIRQLLLSEPTQIIGADSRRTVNEVVVLLMKEAARRGVAVQTDPNTGMPILERGSRVVDGERVS